MSSATQGRARRSGRARAQPPLEGCGGTKDGWVGARAAEVVGQRGGDEPEAGEHEEVDDGGVARQEAGDPPPVAAQRLHDQQVVVLVPLLRKVDALCHRAEAPPAERLVRMQHRGVREVRHARHGLQEPEPVDGPSVEEHVQREAQRVVGHLEHQRGGHLRPRLLPRPNGVVGQRQLLQLRPQLRRGRVLRGAARQVGDQGVELLRGAGAPLLGPPAEAGFRSAAVGPADPRRAFAKLRSASVTKLAGVASTPSGRLPSVPSRYVPADWR